MRLALFDLDNTLLSGDSDALWCEFLVDERLLDRSEFEARNAEIMRGYNDGSVSSESFCNFYASTLAGRSLADWRPWRERFLAEVIRPRIPRSAYDLVESHRALGDRLVMTTATNRVLTELTAKHMRIDDLLATEVEMVEGRCTGLTTGVLNMREGKVRRLQAWLGERNLDASLIASAVFYSDSSNDLPLLEAVGQPVVVDPDPRLLRHAQAAGWRVLRLAR
jgi:HAD superfamily hydrolase (TIGR01490 family)